VGFRWFVERNAKALGLCGSVKNLANGDVELVAEGDRESIDELIRTMKQGNGASSVYRVNTEWLEGEPRYEKFTILRW